MPSFNRAQIHALLLFSHHRPRSEGRIWKRFYIFARSFIYARKIWRMCITKNAHFWGNRRRHHFLLFYQRRRTQPVRRQRKKSIKRKYDVRRVDPENGQRPHRVLFALFQRRRVLLRGDAREEKIR